MVTKVFTIGDPHFKVSNRREMRVFTKACIESINEHEPDFIVVMGDVLDRHENIHVHALMDATEFLVDLSKITKTYVLMGNHDRPNNSNFLTNEHPFTALKGLPNIIIVDNVVVDGEFMFVPYVPPGRFHEAIEGYSLTDLTCIFAHQEFRGANYKCIVSSIGDVWAETLPLVVSGHIHEYQQIQDNIIYVGTPLQHNFGDKDDCSVSYFEFSPDEFTEERIYLDVPKKRIVKLDHEEVKDWLSKDISFNGNTKLVVSGPHDKLQALSKSGVLKGVPENIKVSLVVDNPVVDEELPAMESDEKVNFRTVLWKLVEENADGEQLSRVLNNILGNKPSVVKKIIPKEEPVAPKTAKTTNPPSPKPQETQDDASSTDTITSSKAPEPSSETLTVIKPKSQMAVKKKKKIVFG